jgi:hypothetical protein
VEWILRTAARAKRLDEVELLINFVVRKLIKGNGQERDVQDRSEERKASIASVFILAKGNHNVSPDSAVFKALDRIIHDLELDRQRPEAVYPRKKRRRRRDDEGSWRMAWITYLWCFGK